MRMNKLGKIAAVGTLMGAAVLLPNCNAQDLINTTKGCEGLDVAANQFDASVKAFVAAVIDFNDAAKAAEAEWLRICNAINTEIGEDATKTTAADACGILGARIKKAKADKFVVTATGGCQVDASIQARCDADCYVAAKCDVKAKCEPGKLVVECNGECSGSCDVRAPSFACSGKCEGTCTADIDAVCSAECSGSCTAPSWTGTCDVGCEASFVGQCGGNCTGKCDGSTASGTACAGKCEGTCTAKASGSCAAVCKGVFTKGKCTGTCKGKCAVSGTIDCKGSCNGTCTYTPGTATCQGSCHGSCKVETAPPRCEGSIDCKVDANCQASCSAKAEAKVKCTGSIVVECNDAKLYASFIKHADEIGSAILQTTRLAEKFGTTVVTAYDALQKGTNLTGAGLACIASEAKIFGELKVSVSVSVQASASVSGTAGS